MARVRFSRNTKSSRELRRIGEREKKREQRQEDIKRFWALTPEERAQRIRDNEIFQRIQRNGITMEDMKMAEDKAFADGAQAGMESTMKMCYAAFCLVLKELHGFDTEQCQEILNAVDEKVVFTLTAEELIDEALDEVGLEIAFRNDVGERVAEREIDGECC